MFYIYTLSFFVGWVLEGQTENATHAKITAKTLRSAGNKVLVTTKKKP